MTTTYRLAFRFFLRVNVDSGEGVYDTVPAIKALPHTLLSTKCVVILTQSSEQYTSQCTIHVPETTTDGLAFSSAKQVGSVILASTFIQISDWGTHTSSLGQFGWNDVKLWGEYCRWYDCFWRWIARKSLARGLSDWRLLRIHPASKSRAIKIRLRDREFGLNNLLICRSVELAVVHRSLTTSELGHL